MRETRQQTAKTEYDMSSGDRSSCVPINKNMESETASKGRTLLSDMIRSLIDSLPFPAAGHGLDIGERTYFLQTPFSQGKINFCTPRACLIG